MQNCRELHTLFIDSCSAVTEGIDAIISGGGLEFLSLEAPNESDKVGEKSINTEAVMKISKELEGWEVVGQNRKNLEHLTVHGCRKLCGPGLQALSYGCDKLSSLSVDDKNSCSEAALRIFINQRPPV
ncbi:hypothetical protein C5167_025364 [Papaver somniferum]|uniref:Uncharacterized protein n=1 Tax=Papaver somniferum TaxID=3469 RepID=A0A4Y7JUJ6_PAPSO|nr:hypothetical protein C5167_025364 [Papaver somniferum]